VLFFYLLPMFLYLLPILLHRIHNLNVPVPYVLVPLELCIKEEESLAFVVVESYQHLEGWISLANAETPTESLNKCRL